ncbi:MAG: large subunit ribosomal protein L9 [Planctomycetota bacterium]|jgi:large subunit ribosomal protein L9
MKLVLNENIRGLGSTGDIVTVKNGYGRNFLLPKKLAVYPTEGNLNRLRKERESYLLREADHIDAARLIAEKTKGYIQSNDNLVVKMKANDAGQLFGSVTEAILAAHLGGNISVELHEKQIIMGSHWKRVGDYLAVVRLHSEVEVEFPVQVVAEIVIPEVVEERAEANRAEAEGDDAENAAEGDEAAEVVEEEKTEE